MMTTIRASTALSRREVGPLLSEALEDCRCWTRWRSGGVDYLCLRLELPLRSMEEFYTSLLECGLELDRGGHRDLVTLCTLQHHPEIAAARGGAVELRLELTFLDELCGGARGTEAGVGA